MLRYLLWTAFFFLCLNLIKGQPILSPVRPGVIDCINQKNLSKLKPTKQSSTEAINGSFKAVDGHLIGGNSLTQLDPNSWWEVDMGKIYPLREMVILPATSQQVMGEMVNYFILVSALPLS